MMSEASLQPPRQSASAVCNFSTLDFNAAAANSSIARTEAPLPQQLHLRLFTLPTQEVHLLHPRWREGHSARSLHHPHWGQRQLHLRNSRQLAKVFLLCLRVLPQHRAGGALCWLPPPALPLLLACSLHQLSSPSTPQACQITQCPLLAWFWGGLRES